MINRLMLIILFPMLVTSCIGKYKSEAQKAKIAEASPDRNAVKADTLQVDLTESNLHWKGTKMRGTGKHEGDIALQSAYLLNINGDSHGGQFIADMTTIGVTDIPHTDPIPIKNINNHLKSEDFFEVDRYSTSKFVITHIEKLPNDSISVTGNLTIKDITKHISFGATNMEKTVSAQFTFDRFQWNIAYEGSWAEKTLVDRDVELTIHLRLK